MNNVQRIIELYQKKRDDSSRAKKIKKKWSELVNEKKVVIYGAGVVTFPQLLKLLKEIKIAPVAVVDSDQNKIGRNIKGYPITTLEKVKAMYGNEVIIIIAVRGNEKACHSINNYLKINGFLDIIQCGEWLSYREILDLADYNMMSSSKENLIIKNEKNILGLYKYLNDDRSIRELETIIKARLLPFDFKYEYNSTSYFQKEMFNNESYKKIADCGAYRGDTLEECIQEDFIEFDEYHAFEMDKTNIQYLEKKILSYDVEKQKKIKIHPYAVGDSDGDISICADGSVGSYVTKYGDEIVEVKKLDTVFKDQGITYIKMDIEGAEKSALLGAREIIQKNRPVLVISLYHRDEDLWELPEIIHTTVNDYVGYFRKDGLFEYIYFAIPKEKLN